MNTKDWADSLTTVLQLLPLLPGGIDQVHVARLTALRDFLNLAAAVKGRR